MNKTRKTDRRTIYTCMVIKDTLLSLLAEKEYANITITDLCRRAEINRGTFYLHYSNIHEVIEELFDNALVNMNGVLDQVGYEPVQEKNCAYPLCRFLRDNKKYQALFFSDTLHSHAIDRITAFGWEGFMDRLKTRSGLNENILKEIFRFQLTGCLAISKHNISISDEEWSNIQCSVDRFLKNGYENL